MGAPKLPWIRSGSIPASKAGLNSENSYHPEEQIIYTTMEKDVKVYVWDLPVRLYHWINAVCIVILMVTGIYIGKPFAAASIPEEAYYSNLMGWARYIHFFTAFVFTAAFIYRMFWCFAGNKFARFNPLRLLFWKDLWETIKFYLFLKNKKPHFMGHNPLAFLSYWIFNYLGSAIIILTGFYMYAEPQKQSVLGKLFAWVPYIFGDSYSLRSWHHLVAWAFMLFIVLHVYLAFRDDYLERCGSISSMFTGYKTEPKHAVGEEHDK